jgi:hypothetical protein
MNKSKTATALRCTALAILVLGVLALAPAAVFAQNHTTGLPVTKSCPPTADSGSSYNCTFTVTNADNQHGVINLVVQNTLPFPGGIATTVDCLQGGSAVTTLGASGSGTESCGGTIPETAPINCTASNIFNQDQVAANGNDADTGQFAGLPVSGAATNNTIIPPLVCDDGLFCTDDSCDAATGCVTAPHVCADDANACNGLETCDETADTCVSGPPVVCNSDGNACNGPEACDPATGQCLSGPPITCNDDGNACNGPETCDPTDGSCDSGPALVCDDGLFCTDDSCDPASGCVTAAHDCSDTDECTEDSCNEELDQCDHAPSTDPACNPVGGRMTGGGSIFTKAGGRVTHGFELHCDPEIGPNNLEINWGGGNHFHLEELLTAVCTDDPSIVPRPPSADFDTYNGTGTGSCNGVDGATITFVLTDAGEPGKKDFASFEISGCPGGLSLSVDGNLNKGNQQAHKQ